MNALSGFAGVAIVMLGIIGLVAGLLGFALYLWVYTPWLLRTRLDGKDG